MFPLIPLPTSQIQSGLQATPQPNKKEHSRRLKILIWFLCTIIIGNFPFLGIAIYMNFYGQGLTISELLANGALIAIAIAIVGDTFGQTILLIVNDSDHWIIIKVFIMIATIMAGFVAVFLLDGFVQLTICNGLNPQNASRICLPSGILVIPEASIFTYSVIIFICCFTFGLIAKGLEK